MLIHWIWLATRPDMTDREKVRLLEHFWDPEGVGIRNDHGQADRLPDR